MTLYIEICSAQWGDFFERDNEYQVLTSREHVERRWTRTWGGVRHGISTPGSLAQLGFSFGAPALFILP
jgi:hypothetical protein